MMQAAWERRELDHELLGPDHLLLGLLSNVRGTAYQLLGEYGVTYEWARRVVKDKHDDSAYASREERETESTSDLDEDREALRAIGIDLDKVRDAVRKTFGEDITERWGERRERGGRDRGRRGGPHGHGPHGRGGRGNGPHGHGPHGPDMDGDREDPEFDAFATGFGPGGYGRGRRGPRSRRFEQVAPSMHRILHQLRRELHDTHSRDDRGEHPAAAGMVLAALFNSGDPVIEAIIDAADDPKGLRAAVEKFAGHATA